MTIRRWILVAVLAILAIAGGLAVVNLAVAPSPGGYADRIGGVQYYPACGNETLEFEGRTWYPIARDDWAPPVDRALGVTGGAGIAMSVPTVAAPGPGDNVGTLYLWNTGRAYWVSDNGELATWLTVVPQRYNWVC